MSQVKRDVENSEGDDIPLMLDQTVHELRNLLTIADGHVQLLKKCLKSRARKGDPQIDKHLHKIETCIADMIAVSGEIRALQEGSPLTAMHFRSCSIANFIEDIQFSYGPSAAEKNLKLKILTKEPCQEIILSDPFRLRQIVGNLISNAIKYTERGEVRVDCWVKGDFLKIVVSDTGRGLPDIAHDRIFLPYIRETEGCPMENASSEGLGLSVARKLARMMGGDVTLLHSKVGKGSAFEAKLRCN